MSCFICCKKPNDYILKERWDPNDKMDKTYKTCQGNCNWTFNRFNNYIYKEGEYVPQKFRRMTQNDVFKVIENKNKLIKRLNGLIIKKNNEKILLNQEHKKAQNSLKRRIIEEIGGKYPETLEDLNKILEEPEEQTKRRRIEEEEMEKICEDICKSEGF